MGKWRQILEIVTGDLETVFLSIDEDANSW